MKKTVYIILAALLVLVLVAVGTVMWFLFKEAPDPESQQKTGFAVLDAKGDVLVRADTYAGIYEEKYWAYLELALQEAEQILAKQEGCSAEEARKKLLAGEYQIHTAFDSAAFDALQAVESRWGNTRNTACAITDLKGNLLAVSCTDQNKKQINYASDRRSPYSSFKALSVYTPAVEKGIVNWSTKYQDAPYKKLKDDKGNLQDWPTNADGSFSKKEMTVYEALRTSLNTVAVKCLADVGVTESMRFLQDSFGIGLTQEQYVVENYGAEEVIGNIALGYLETGITPVEMAGYYQIFANGGKYTPPKAVTAIKGSDGTDYYTRQDAAKQVVRPETADVMNRLLQGVLAPGGTGEMAKCAGIEIAGKTGTGDNYADNWFVGVTPGYSLAVWHGQHDTNQAEEMFASVIRRLYQKMPDANRNFITHSNIAQLAYCIHSGKAFSANCTLIEAGYFVNKDALPVCDTCGKSK